jgi:hypothetical protein
MRLSEPRRFEQVAPQQKLMQMPLSMQKLPEPVLRLLQHSLTQLQMQLHPTG